MISRILRVRGKTEKYQFKILNKSFTLKFLLSLWLCYHLFCIIILPNGSSFLGRYFEAEILPYANAIGINSTWNFYSPDPANTMYFSYIVHFENEQGEELKPSIEEFLPPEKDKIVTDSSRRRLLYAMRYLALDPHRLQAIMAPWICREYEGASRIIISHIIERIPSLDNVLSRIDENVNELREKQESPSFDYNCRKKTDEMDL